MFKEMLLQRSFRILQKEKYKLDKSSNYSSSQILPK